MAMAPVEVLVGNLALDETTVTDVVRLSITILLGASGVVAWIFSKRARARSSLGRMGVDISDASLARCIADGDLKAIELLLRTGIRADAPLNGRTPLQAAIKAGDERVIGLLVRRAPPEAVVRELLRDSVPEAAPSGSPAFTVLPGVQGVLEHIQRQIISALDSGERTEMLNLGLDLEVVQTFLLYKLIFQKNLRNLEYHGMLIESSAERIKPVIDGGSSIHSGTATAVIEKIGNQIAENAAFLDSSNISIEIRSYDLPPVLHGFLVDNRHLYLGFTEFVQGKLHGGEFGYLYLDRLAADPMTAHLFRVYRSWFEFQWNHGTKLCAS
ncbi:hypothetical protein [Amycolatopsis sp. NPDC003676]